MKQFDITEKDNFLKMEIMETLRLVIDPELEINIIDLGLVYAVYVKENQIEIEMTLSSSHCPMGSSIVGGVQNCLEQHYPDYKTTVNLVWEPAWSHKNISEEGKRLLGI
ncbi:FeS assembly SUF system protein [Pedobacter glucosidilyticus]|nr:MULTISPECIES: metal-sulfur cluster assembly factor [Pedobacter]KHJ39540.1 FeS assembly SUF system protein [Pedobacter glucosidilyticus]